MSWNYRIVRYHDGSGFGLHEVHYNDDGTAYAMTEAPCRFSCGADEEPGAITDALQRALTDASCLVTFDEPAEWAEPAKASPSLDT